MTRNIFIGAQVRLGEAPYSSNLVRSAGNSSYNYDNPILRDVVNMGALGDEVTIRFVADNLGAWFFHCHINWHLTK